MRRKREGATRPAHILLILIVVCLMSGLVGCSEADAEIGFAIGEAWAISRGIWDGNNLDFGALTREVSNDLFDQLYGEPDQAALDTARVTDAIRKADASAAAGMEALAAGDNGTAIEKMDEAVKARPGDYVYRQQRAAALLAAGEVQQYSKDTVAAHDIMLQQAQGRPTCTSTVRDFHRRQFEALQQVETLACDQSEATCQELRANSDAHERQAAAAQYEECPGG